MASEEGKTELLIDRWLFVLWRYQMGNGKLSGRRMGTMTGIRKLGNASGTYVC